ncbi:MAG: hypothetical protein KAH32_05850 [Chlamydiia bacterium]|nr:hypothetical protein [Chlamydiia bacterium]
MESFLRSLKGSFSKIHEFGLRGMSNKKNMLIVIIVAVLTTISLRPISRLASAVYKEVTRKLGWNPKDTSGIGFISKSKESMDCFKGSCATPELLNSKKALDYVNTQQFSALRAFGQSKINFESLHTVLRFGLQDLEKIALGKRYEDTDEDGFKKMQVTSDVVSEYVVLNPALLDNKQSFHFDLQSNILTNIESNSIRDTDSVGEDHNHLSTKEKILYVGLGLIGAYSNVVNTYADMHSQEEGASPAKKEELDLLTKKEDKIFREYMEAYIDLCSKNDSSLQDAIKLVDTDILVPQKGLGGGHWKDPKSSMMDKTSLLLILNMSRTLKRSGQLNIGNDHKISGMIIDRDDFLLKGRYKDLRSLKYDISKRYSNSKSIDTR